MRVAAAYALMRDVVLILRSFGHTVRKEAAGCAAALASKRPTAEGGDPVTLSGLVKALKRILTLGRAK